MLTVKFKDEEPTDRQEYEPIRPGTYFLTVVDVEETESKKGAPMVKVQFEVSPGQECEGRSVYDYIVFMDSMLWKVQKFLKCIGEPYKGEVKIDPDQWIARVCKVRIETQDYKNQNGDLRLKDAIVDYMFDDTIKQDRQEKVQLPPSSSPLNNIDWEA